MAIRAAVSITTCRPLGPDSMRLSEGAGQSWANGRASIPKGATRAVKATDSEGSTDRPSLGVPRRFAESGGYHPGAGVQSLGRVQA
jgi:hypothetical protein